MDKPIIAVIPKDAIEAEKELMKDAIEVEEVKDEGKKDEGKKEGGKKEGDNVDKSK